MHDESTPNPAETSGESLGPTDAATLNETSIGGDVLSLIADVEKHLERIREVQNRQTSDFANIAERQRRVAEAESVASARAEELARTSDELEAARREIEDRTRELESRQSMVEEEHRAVHRLQEELEAVRHELDAERDRVAEWAAEIDASRRELDERGADLKRREHDLVTRLATAEAAAAAAQSELERVTSIHENRLSSIERERRDAAGRESSLQARYEAAESARGEFERGIAERERKLTESRETAARTEESLAAAEQELADARTSLETLGDELDTVTGRVRDLEERCREEASSHQTTVREMQDRCAANERELAEGREAIEVAEARASEADAALESARSRVESLESRIVEDERQLSVAGAKVTELARVISEHAPQLERGAEAMALVPELEAEIRRLGREISSVSSEPGETQRAEFEERIADLERELAAAQAEASSDDGIDTERTATMIAEARAPLERRVAELDEQLQKARTESDEVVSRGKYESVRERCRKAERRSDELEMALSMTHDRGQAQEMAKRLRSKAERVGEFARHLDLRRRRLASVRAALAVRRNERVVVNGGDSNQELQRLEVQRRELEQVREFLGRSEQQMVRRWARPRSVALVAWFAVLVALSVGAGWFGARNLLPTPGVATVSLAAAVGAGGRLTAEQAEGWRVWHEALATDPAFVVLVRKRLAARGLAPAGGDSEVARILTENLSFEPEGTGRLRLLLSGPDARGLEPTLDAVAAAMASESARQAPRRLDGTRATLPAEREGARGVLYASLVGGPMSEALLIRMGSISGVVLLSSLLLVWVLYAVLSRSKRIFEAQEAAGEEVPAA